MGNIKIICDDSQSRKRRFDTIEKTNDENANCLPPKAKQRTDDNGNWTKRKDIRKDGGSQQDFSRFLQWAKPNGDGKESAVLSAKPFDSDRNVLKSKNMIVCGPAMNRKQFRRRKRTKSTSQSPNAKMMKEQKEEEEKEEEEEEDIDVKEKEK